MNNTIRVVGKITTKAMELNFDVEDYEKLLHFAEVQPQSIEFSNI